MNQKSLRTLNLVNFFEPPSSVEQLPLISTFSDRIHLSLQKNIVSDLHEVIILQNNSLTTTTT